MVQIDWIPAFAGMTEEVERASYKGRMGWTDKDGGWTDKDGKGIREELVLCHE